MSLRLILMRHAKSDWDSPAKSDFERPLSKRGRIAATAIGDWLSRNDYIPETVLCSAAKRTRETLSRVLSELDKNLDVKYLQPLYLAAPEFMLQTLRKQQQSGTILMVAHNPGTAILANALAENAPPHERFDDYPSGATTIFTFDIETWQTIAPGSGQVSEFIVPRDIVSAPKKDAG